MVQLYLPLSETPTPLSEKKQPNKRTLKQTTIENYKLPLNNRNPQIRATGKNMI